MTDQIFFDEASINKVVLRLIALMNQLQVFTFTGPLGVGKTTLIKEILKECNVSQTVTSPTFTYLNVYENDKNQLFYHFDLYRINSLDEFLAAGFEEYLYAPNSWTFIEWPAIIMPLLKEKVCHCELEYVNDTRKIIINHE